MKTYTSMKIVLDTPYCNDELTLRDRFTPAFLDTAAIIAHFAEFGKAPIAWTKRDVQDFLGRIRTILRDGEWRKPRTTATKTTVDVVLDDVGAEEQYIAHITLRHHDCKPKHPAGAAARRRPKEPTIDLYDYLDTIEDDAETYADKHGLQVVPVETVPFYDLLRADADKGVIVEHAEAAAWDPATNTFTVAVTLRALLGFQNPSMITSGDTDIDDDGRRTLCYADPAVHQPFGMPDDPDDLLALLLL